MILIYMELSHIKINIIFVALLVVHALLGMHAQTVQLRVYTIMCMFCETQFLQNYVHHKFKPSLGGLFCWTQAWSLSEPYVQGVSLQVLPWNKQQKLIFICYLPLVNLIRCL